MAEVVNLLFFASNMLRDKSARRPARIFVTEFVMKLALVQWALDLKWNCAGDVLLVWRYIAVEVSTVAIVLLGSSTNFFFGKVACFRHCVCARGSTVFRDSLAPARPVNFFVTEEFLVSFRGGSSRDRKSVV